jgi:DNA-directed RNA polymerase subunit D
MFMKVKVISKKGDKMVFVLDGATPALANALRRIMVSEVPTLSVEWLDMHDNNSILYDEMIAHRMGLIPLRFDMKRMNFTADCKCSGKGCNLCQAVFALDKEGPCIVHTSDLKSSNREVKPTSPNFPIVELLKGQKVRFEAVARLGIGLNHAKWQAGNVGYQYYPEQKEAGDARAVKLCPKDALKAAGNKAKLAYPEKCDLCEACFEAGMKVEGSPNKIIFQVESVSGLEPAEIVSKAVEVLSGKAQEFKKLTAKI